MMTETHRSLHCNLVCHVETQYIYLCIYTFDLTVFKEKSKQRNHIYIISFKHKLWSKKRIQAKRQDDKCTYQWPEMV